MGILLMDIIGRWEDLGTGTGSVKPRLTRTRPIVQVDPTRPFATLRITGRVGFLEAGTRVDPGQPGLTDGYKRTAYRPRRPTSRRPMASWISLTPIPLLGGLNPG